MYPEVGGRNSNRKNLQKPKSGGMRLKENSGVHVEKGDLL